MLCYHITLILLLKNYLDQGVFGCLNSQIAFNLKFKKNLGLNMNLTTEILS